MIKQIPTVTDTLYTRVSVPAESTAFLDTANAQVLMCVAPLVHAVHSDRFKLQEALNMAAILSQLCRVELANQPGGCITTLPEVCRWLLVEHCVWVMCVTEIHSLCWVSY